MARHLFGLSPADLAMERVGDEVRLRPGAVGTVWDALTGGAQITDLLDRDGLSPIVAVTADAEAIVGFYGPDDVSLLYVDFGFGVRFAMPATDLGPIVDGKLDIDGGTMTGPLIVPDLNVTGLADLDGVLTVAGAASFAADITVVGDADVDGDLFVGGTLLGGTAASADLYIGSSSDATKGHIVFGDSGIAIDEEQGRLGVGNILPSVLFEVKSGANGAVAPIRVWSTGAAAANRALSVRGSGDTADHFFIDHDGSMQWGAGGASAADTNLFRDAADRLKTDDEFEVGTRLGVGQDPDATIRIVSGLTTDNPVMALNSTITNATHPIVRLESGGANGFVQAHRVTGDTQYRFMAKADGRLEWGAGGVTARDTNLYRNAVNELKTDDALTVALTLNVTGLATFGGGIDINAGLGTVLFARKTADQSVNNSTTLVNDTHLTVSMEANSTYVVEVVFSFVTLAAADLKTAFSIPSGATSHMMITGPDAQIGYVINGTTADQWPVTDTTEHAGHYHGVVVTTTAGTFRFQFAQLTAAVGNTTLKANSYIRATRVA